MAFISLPDCVKIEIIFRKNNAPVVNIVWGRVGIPIDNSVLSDIALAVKSWWITNRKADTVSTMALEEIRVTDWTTQFGLQHIEPVTPPEAGSSAAGDLPSNVAAVVTFRTAQRGRSFRGRNYVCGFGDTAVTGNTLSTALVTQLVSDYALLQTALNSVDVTMGVASFYTGNAPRAEGVLTPINTIEANNVVDTQRRRIPRVFQ